MKKSNKQKGIDFENKFIKTINSGAFFQNGDATSKEECLEMKYTERKSFSITLKILEKIWDEALTHNKMPRLAIGIKRNEQETFLIDCNISLK